MKAFDEHLARRCPFVRPTSDCAAFAEQNWRAALEWVYVEMTGTDLSRTRDIINEELDDD